MKLDVFITRRTCNSPVLIDIVGRFGQATTESPYVLILCCLLYYVKMEDETGISTSLDDGNIKR